MQKWEYCQIDTFRNPKVARFVERGAAREEVFAAGIEGTLAYMASLGELGWEMTGIEVRVESSTSPQDLTQGQPVRSQPVYWFKRPVS